MTSDSARSERIESTDLHVEATQRLMEALVESDDRMRRRVNLLADVIFETDAGGSLIFLSDAWRDLTGREPTESLGEPILDHLIEEDRAELSRLFADPTSVLGPLTTRLMHIEGKPIWVTLSASRLDDGGHVGVLHDFRQEKKIQDERSMLSVVARATDNLVIITDQSGRIEWVNPAFENRTGWTLAEVAGRTPGSFLQGAETDRDTVRRLRSGLESRSSLHEEILNYTRAGEPYWIDLDITPVIDASGRLTRYIAVQAETTDRKRYEEEILNQQVTLEERVVSRTADLKRAKEAAEEAMIANQVFTLELSKAYESLKLAQAQRRDLLDRMKSLSRRIGIGDGERPDLVQAMKEVTEAIGVTLAVECVVIQLVDPDGQPGARHAWSSRRGGACTEGNRSADLDEIFSFLACHEGTIAASDIGEWAGMPGGTAAEHFARGSGASSALICPIVTSAGLNLGILLLGESLKGRQWSEDEIVLVDTVASDFGRAVVSATLFDSQQALLHDLKELDRAKDEMMSTFSHELRTPLTSIRAYVELLRSGESHDGLEPDRMLEIIEQNSVRLTALIEDILTLSHLESEVFQTELTALEIDPLLSSVGAMMRPTAALSGISISVQAAGSGGYVVASASQLERLVINLVSNAIKFSHDGETVTIGSSIVEDQLKIRVSDTGIGIPASQCESVFERFVRGSNARAQVIAGTGLGLPIAKAIVEHHGGTLDLESTENVGTTVTVTLPLAKGPVDDTHADQGASASELVR